MRALHSFASRPRFRCELSPVRYTGNLMCIQSRFTIQNRSRVAEYFTRIRPVEVVAVELVGNTL